ncbi:MAG: hypothetical protein RI894_866 [Bacteroidota bacterium]|jgi:cell wall-associated NlpC family hydrolase
MIPFTYFTTQLSVVPIRALPTHKSEQVSQLLFGEAVLCLRKQGEWLYIRCRWDDYEGWVQAVQLSAVSEAWYAKQLENQSFAFELLLPASTDDSFLPLPLGASLPYYDGINARLGETHYRYTGQILEVSANLKTADWVLKIALRYLHAPYLWGGRSPFGIDCSGLAQMAFLMTGVLLPRDASQQITCGETVDFLQNAQPADLAFFCSEQGNITHVGILLDANTILHASGQVRIDAIDGFGIFNRDLQKHTHQLCRIKRIF